MAQEKSSLTSTFHVVKFYLFPPNANMDYSKAPCYEVNFSTEREAKFFANAIFHGASLGGEGTAGIAKESEHLVDMKWEEFPDEEEYNLPAKEFWK